MALSKSFRLFHKLDPPYSVILEERNIDESLLFESKVVGILSTSEVDTLKKTYNYARLSDAYGCLGVLSINGGNAAESNLYLVMITGASNVGKVQDVEISRVTGVQIVPLQPQPSGSNSADERIHDLQKLLSTGSFYFGWSGTKGYCDLSLGVQRAEQYDNSDPRFFWNRTLFEHLKNFNVDVSRWLIRIVCGGFEVRTVYAGNTQARCCIFSRLSAERVGTRFECRGANDDGHVANFCETEQILYVDDQVSSFLQIRGSVPLFWDQPGIQVGAHKVRMSRGDEASAPVYNRHMNMLKRRYGDVAMVNLLGTKEGEDVVSKAFHRHHQVSIHAQDVPLIYFDYHSECRHGKVERIDKIKPKLIDVIHQHNYFLKGPSGTTKWQTGAIRTNCMDCLDRTNAVQTYLGMEVLQLQLQEIGVASASQAKSVSRIVDAFQAMWTANGDHLARIYAGTGAIGGGRSKAADASRSVSRTIQNNFLDDKKQEAIDLLLYGNTLKTELGDKVYALFGPEVLHLPFPLLRDLIVNHQDFVTPSSLRVCVGTWNVNGGKNVTNIAFRHQTSLADWLVDAPKLALENRPATVFDPSCDWNSFPDVFAVGFEEMVDLDAKNMIKTSSENQRIWASEILKTLNATGEAFMPIYSEQLVGVCLYVFTKRSLAPYIKDVAVNTVKTGLGGAAGNKGGVAIRFVFKSTSLCFVCAHLAAGQKEIKERNENYNEIMKKIQFPSDICRGKSIINHDYVFWCGDFNYRIDMANDQVKLLISKENWQLLSEGDQLLLQKKDNRTFAGFSEGEIHFPPTYKYDLFSDDYDTSEKCRCPAWTDRVLWRRRQLTRDVEVDAGRLIYYGRAELKTSDHRPVVAWFDVEVFDVDKEKRRKAFQLVALSHGPPDASVIVGVVDTSGNQAFVDQDAETFIMDKVAACGEILLVRFVGDSLQLTMRSGKMALDVVERCNAITVGSKAIKLNVQLVTPNWHEAVYRDLEETLDPDGQVRPLYNRVSCQLLGEEFQVPDMQTFDPSGGLLNLPGVARSPFTSGRATPVDLLTPNEEVDTDTLVDSLNALSPASPSRSPGAKPPPRPKAGPNRPPPPRTAPPAVTPGGPDAEVMESCLGVPSGEPMERCPSASSLAAHARSQESLVSAGDDVISSQPHIVTDPNCAWGEEPTSTDKPVTDAAIYDDGASNTNAVSSTEDASRDPFGDGNDALARPFESTDFATNNRAASKDPFEGSGWGTEPDTKSLAFNGIVNSSPSSLDSPPPPPLRTPITASKSPSVPMPCFTPPALSTSRPPPSAPPPSRPPAIPPPAVPTRTTPTHGPSVPKRPNASDGPVVPPRGPATAPPPVPGRSASSGAPPVPARGVKKTRS